MLWISISSLGAPSYVPVANIILIIRVLPQVDAPRQVSEALVYFSRFFIALLQYIAGLVFPGFEEV